MKKTITLFFIAFSLQAILLQAQPITNNGFEQLNSDGTISYWGNVYIFSAWFDSLGVSHTDSIIYDGPFYAPTYDAHSGSNALELRNAWNFTTNTGIVGAAGLDNDTVFSSWGASNMIPTNATPGNPFEPLSLSFYHKYFPVNGDSAYVEVTLWDSSGNPVAEGIQVITDANSTFTYSSVNLNYYTPGSADYYSIIIRNFYTEIPGYREPSLGTRLIVDDLEFNFAAVGTNTVQTEKQIAVFPNPVSDKINIHLNSEKNSSYKIYNGTGKLILQGSLFENKSVVSLNNFDEGIYFIEIINGKEILTEKFMVNKN